MESAYPSPASTRRVSASEQEMNALAASIDTLPPRHSDLSASGTFVGNGVVLGKGSTGRNMSGGGQGRPVHARADSKTDFLDLADSSDIAARLEQKRVEYERQRELQKRAFEQQMKALEVQQEREERELLASAPPSKTTIASSAPATPPRSDDDEPVPRSRSGNDLAAIGGRTRGSANGPRNDYSSAKSVPASRRQSGDHAETLGLEKLAIAGNGGNAGANARLGLMGGQKTARLAATRNQSGEPPLLTTAFLFDDDIDADLQNSAYGGKYLQVNTDDDKFPILVRRDSYPGILSASSAALDLAPLSQTPPRSAHRMNERGSEWPQFSEPPRNVGNATAATTSPVQERRGLTSMPIGSNTSSVGAVAAAAPNGGGGYGDHSGAPQTSPVVGRASTLPSSAVASGRTSPMVELSPARTTSMQLGAMGMPGAAGYGGMEYGGGRNSGAFASYNEFGSMGGGAGAFGGYESNPYGSMNSMSSQRNSSIYMIKPKREAEINRFAGLRLEDLQGDMFALCKDQHGCRFLQKKLEDGVPEHRDMIYHEIFPHFAELMIDPFGNYLSQKLLEYCSDEQRDALIESISNDLVNVSLNMHGTRAVQKMIDFLSTRKQVQSLIMALNMHVVGMIKDLNANHCIQKCLNHLPPEDNQFIYTAVATNCVEVATHRHGCCVLQRCIDHASESQRIQLVTEITYNSLTLVQDPFGNYVVQYVLDLNDPRFIEAIVRQFLGNVCALSASKFSSNVVEKCIRVSDPAGRKALVDEILDRSRLERLLRDSFANYVVQTALDYADPIQRAQLVDNIRPILPLIRNTPYGKRIQSKIQRESANDYARGGGGGGGGGGFPHPGMYGVGGQPPYMPYGGLSHQFAHPAGAPGMHGHAMPAGDMYGSRASPYMNNQLHLHGSAHGHSPHPSAGSMSGIQAYDASRYTTPLPVGLGNGMDGYNQHAYVPPYM